MRMYSRKPMKLIKRNGFTLVEVVIVAGIIVLLSALSIAGLWRARVSANDNAAARNAESIAAALEAYGLVHSGYTESLNDLITADPPYLSTAFTDGSHQGYDFSIILEEGDQYHVVAEPQQYGITGTKYIVYDGFGLQKFDDYDAMIAYIPGGVIQRPGNENPGGTGGNSPVGTNPPPGEITLPPEEDPFPGEGGKWGGDISGGNPNDAEDPLPREKDNK